MTDRDKFRGQDPDHEFSQDDGYPTQDEYPTHDEMSSSMSGYDESSMQQDRSGWPPEGEGDHPPQRGYHGQDETTSNLGEGMRSRRPGEERGRGRSGQDDEFGDEETGAW
ncbi:hypothetical protein [Actinomadura sp. GTD37]|uniref:hypothetical protein n=1 Tax=Actinomadura sp. GTD37 TaxID=1778030 RepID=UPI0035C162B2